MKRLVLGLSACVLSGAILAPSAVAAPDDFTCRASAARVAAPVLSSPVEPTVANNPNDPCVAESRTLVPIAIPANTGGILRAPISNAITTRSPSAATAFASVTNATVNVGPGNILNPSTVSLTADVIEARAAATCVNGSPALSGSSRLANLRVRLLGIPLTVPVNAAPNTVLVNLLGIRVVLNEQTTSGGELTVRAIHISAPLLRTDVVVSEARAGSKGNPCAPPPPKPECSDGIDNDGDKQIDFPNDPGCDSATDDDETDTPKQPECSDGIDNDGDKQIDFPNDPGCDSATDDDETDTPKQPECSDGIDNDGDKQIDFPNDPGCDSATDDDETDTPKQPECDDGIDNDGDKQVDFPYDPGCSSKTDDSESDTPKY